MSRLSRTLQFCFTVLLIAYASGVHAEVAEPSHPISRCDGFLLLWRSISRPAEQAKVAFIDLHDQHPCVKEVTYAASRKIIETSSKRFRPNDPLITSDALLWLFRTRNIEPRNLDGTLRFMEIPDPQDIPSLTKEFGFSIKDFSAQVTEKELVQWMQKLDQQLLTKEREASLYAEDFHGQGTAFGEKFDMHAFTAAHRSFPYNTLVRVTNLENNKSVVVRINDRGPFIQGRDIDLSLAAFTSIAERKRGKIRIRLERLGDITLARQCGEEHRFQRRVGPHVLLRPGVPWSLRLGTDLRLRSEAFFAVLGVTYPDGNILDIQQWIGPSEQFTFTPSIPGKYSIYLRSTDDRRRRMEFEVHDCGSL